MTEETDRYCGSPAAGSSDTARAFGAEVSVGMEGRSLFFVLGRGGQGHEVSTRFDRAIETRELRR